MSSQIVPFVVSLLGSVALPCPAAEDTIAPTLAEIRETSKKQQLEGTLDIASTSAEFHAAIGTADLSPSDDFTTKSAALQGICTTLLESLVQRNATATPAEVERVAEATKALLGKIDAAIDESYQFQLETANVSPPAGVPNSASGMDPNAISDPNLRKRYLETIAKEKGKRNKNTQQRELRRTRQILLLHLASLASASPTDELTNEKVIEKFNGDGASRKSLTKIISPKSEEK